MGDLFAKDLQANKLHPNHTTWCDAARPLRYVHAWPFIQSLSADNIIKL